MTKYRRFVLLSPISNKVKEIPIDISNRADSKFSIDVLETDRNNIYLTVDHKPTVTMSQIVRRLKQISTDRIWILFPNEQRSFHWKVGKRVFLSFVVENDFEQCYNVVMTDTSTTNHKDADSKHALKRVSFIG